MLETWQNNRLNVLAEKMQQGDRRAAGKIFDYFNPLFFRFFVGRTLNRDVAEDLAQDVFFKILNRIGTYRKDSGNFSAWAWQIAKHRLIDYYREKKTVSIEDFLQHRNMAEDKRPALHSKLEADNVFKLVSGLTAEEQELFSLRYISELPYKEISELTKKSEGSLRIMIHRLNNKLKKLLTR